MRRTKKYLWFRLLLYVSAYGEKVETFKKSGFTDPVSNITEGVYITEHIIKTGKGITYIHRKLVGETPLRSLRIRTEYEDYDYNADYDQFPDVKSIKRHIGLVYQYVLKNKLLKGNIKIVAA